MNKHISIMQCVIQEQRANPAYQLTAAVAFAPDFPSFLNPAWQKLFHSLLPLFDQNFSRACRQAMRPSANSKLGGCHE